MRPAAWLAAARTGGRPEPYRTRWQPLRVGVVNLWEYDDAEFWYADGRLVLRGGNGAGKTKLLELTTLMLLRGEIMPAVLDPFGSQHRTMRFNLLPTGEEDDPRPMTDTGLGYAWAEYGRLDGNGEASYLVCGMGASARRGSGTDPVKRWMFLTSRRPGPDLVLAPAAGPLDEKELRKEHGVRVYDNGARYRADLAAELFELDPSGFDNLTDLLKQLRRPKLGERLNPKELERTLRDALPQLATGEVTQLVEGWDRLEELRRRVETLEAAAAEVAGFTRRYWLPWARVVVRRRSNDLATATTQLDNTTRARRRAEDDLERARTEVGKTGAELARAKGRYNDHRTELRELVDSSAYQDAVAAIGRAESLRREADREARLAKEAETRAENAAERLGQAEDALTDSDQHHRDAAVKVAERAEDVLARAVDAGLAVTALVEARDVPGLRSAHGMRAERLDHLLGLRREWQKADADLDQVARTLQDREATAERIRRQVEEADAAAAAEAEKLGAELTRWAAGLQAAPCTQQQLSEWHALIPEVTEQRSFLLSGALGEHADAAGSLLHDRLATAKAVRVPLDQRHAELDAELARVRSVAEEPPAAPTLWARRRRPDDDGGAPLWACVQPRGMDETELAWFEATLAAAGLLDAWLTPHGELITDPETVLQPSVPVSGNLLRVLGPTPSGGVGAERIEAVLSGIGWFPDRLAAVGDLWLAADGSWRVGALTGLAEPAQPASYLGATAREQARRRTIARLEEELAEVQSLIEANRRDRTEIEEGLGRLAGEVKARPKENELIEAAIDAANLRQHLDGAQTARESAQQEHDEAVTVRDRTRALAAGYAADHAFALDGLEQVARALASLSTNIDRLEGDLELLRARRDQLGKAQKEREAAAADDQSHREALAAARETARQAEITARTAYEALGTGHQAQLDRREELDRLVSSLEDQVSKLTDKLTDLRLAEKDAVNVLNGHEEKRKAAETHRDEAARTWWRAADSGLVVPLGIDMPASRTVEATLDAARAVRRDAPSVQADAQAQERTWRQCLEALQRLRQILLPNRDGIVRDDDGDDLPQVMILAGPSTGYLPPDAADAALAEQARAQKERFDAEQQRMLTRLLGSAFIEHLKDRLDYTESVFTRINTCLANHPTRQGHTLQLMWQAAPDDLEAGHVVEALRQGYEHLAPARQDMVRGFLRRKIEEAREEAKAKGLADWQDELAIALDYRRWLRIELQFRPGSTGRWRQFDAARHGSKSGGEKVVLLSQPLFAAAVVAYDAAGSAAPRQVWLDEAMTGVDNEVKATFMGLTVELDLDVMITAHDEWCRYSTVPAAAVYDLARQRHLPGVDALPHLWCAGEWTVLDSTLSARGPDEDSFDEEGTLFA